MKCHKIVMCVQCCIKRMSNLQGLPFGPHRELLPSDTSASTCPLQVIFHGASGMQSTWDLLVKLVKCAKRLKFGICVTGAPGADNTVSRLGHAEHSSLCQEDGAQASGGNGANHVSQPP